MTWHTVSEAAPLIGVSAETVYLLCASGRLSHRRIGIKPGKGRIEVSDEGIAEFLKSCEIPAAPSPAPQQGAGLAPGVTSGAGAKRRPKAVGVSGRQDGKPIKDIWR